MTEPDDAALFDSHLDRTASPETAAIARSLRATVLEEAPAAVEWFDGGNGLLAFGSRRVMRDLLFAIIPHRAHVNLQLADGADLPNRDGLIEGTGKRIRHVKIRSVEASRSAAVREIVRAQVSLRSGGGSDRPRGAGRPLAAARDHRPARRGRPT